VKRFLSTFAILAVTFCWAGEENADREAMLANFKRKVMPHVGKEFVVSGHLQPGKFGEWISFDGDGAYIEPKGTNSLARLNSFDRFRGKEVTVKGILHFQPELRSTNQLASGIPEHFYFDAGQCEITEKIASTKVTPAKSVKTEKSAGDSTNAKAK
jgi:hypothetical protein